MSRGSVEAHGLEVSQERLRNGRDSGWRIEHYSRHYQVTVDQVTSLSKWLTASLLAVNSGGLVSLMSHADTISHSGWAAASFLLGLLFSLLGAVANQEIYNRMSEPIMEMLVYWQDVGATGQSDGQKHDLIAEKLRKISRWTFFGPVFGWVSGLAFFGGASAIALSLL